jgi:ABC-type transporter MlaC component
VVEIAMDFNRRGADLFERITGEHVGERLAIILDDRVYSAPVIRDSFALPQIARSAAGPYWGTFTEEERKIYLRTFAEWIIANYAGRFKEYSGENFIPVSESMPEKGTITVTSKLIDRTKDEWEFHYRFRQVKGAWRIIDVRIMGISQLLLTKVQIVFITTVKGFGGLISMLNDKIIVLSQDNE